LQRSRVLTPNARGAQQEVKPNDKIIAVAKAKSTPVDVVDMKAQPRCGADSRSEEHGVRLTVVLRMPRTPGGAK